MLTAYAIIGKTAIPMWPWSALAPRHGVAVVALEALQGTSAVRVAVAVPRANRHALRRRHVLLHRRSDLAEACAAEQRGSRSRHRPSTRGPSWHSVAIADTTDTAVTTYAGIPAPADTHSLVMVRVRWCTWLCAGAAGAWEVAGKEARGQRPARHCVTTPPSHDHLSPRARVSRKLGGGQPSPVRTRTVNNGNCVGGARHLPQGGPAACSMPWPWGAGPGLKDGNQELHHEMTHRMVRHPRLSISTLWVRSLPVLGVIGGRQH